MSDASHDFEKRVSNGSTLMEAISELSPDADPGVLMATIEEISLIREATRRLYDWGLVRQVVFGVVLDNEAVLGIEVDNR